MTRRETKTCFIQNNDFKKDKKVLLRRNFDIMFSAKNHLYQLIKEDCILMFDWSEDFHPTTTKKIALKSCLGKMQIIYNYPPKGRWIVVDIYRDAKRRGIYPPLFTDPEGESYFSIYQIRWIRKYCFNFLFWNFRETTRHFSFRSQNSE